MSRFPLDIRHDVKLAAEVVGPTNSRSESARLSRGRQFVSGKKFKNR